MRVSVIGSLTVTAGAAEVSGPALGGRRARVVLVALALAGGDVPAHRLATLVWGEQLPPTWQTALRGIVRGLRKACASLTGSGELIETAAAGYRLAHDVQVDTDVAERHVLRASDLLAADRPQAALDLVAPLARVSGQDLLPGVDAAWLEPYRQRVDGTAMRACDLLVECATRLGQHRRAIDAARGAVAAWPLDEGSHRSLMRALSRFGDRAGAVAAYEHCRSVLADELGVDPDAETVAMYLEALRDQPGKGVARIPASLTSFVGREAESAALAEAMDSGGLVTVTGRGGVGKSRVVAHVAATRRDLTSPALWVSLATVADPELVASTVALELGVHVGADDAEVSVASYLGPLGRTLLVLDGCEAVRDGVASLVTTLPVYAPLLTIVATSRWPLGVEAEKIVEVAPMAPVALWTDDAAAGDLDALKNDVQVRLLMDRVREGGGELTLDPHVAPDVVALCRRCDGLPLALELVAAQLAAIPPGDLLDHLHGLNPHLDDQLRSVTRGSYELLDEDEQSVFRSAAVLEGPMGLSLLREVAAGERIPAVRVVRVLRELTARGLLTVDRAGPR